MSTTLTLPGKTALVTGGAGGIGAAVATALAARGTNIVLADLGGTGLDRTASSLPAGQVLPIPADVTDAAAMHDVVTAAVERFGRLDIVFANAGIAADPPSTARTMPPSVFERVVEVDLLGVWRTVQPALEHVIARRGHILTTASAYAFVNGMVNAPYAASKAAVEQLGRALRAELAPHGASAGVLYPGWVATPIADSAFGGDPLLTAFKDHTYKGPLRKAITPERVAAAVVPGIERRAPRIIVPRRWLPLSMLRGIVNPLVDRALERDHTLHRLVHQLEAQRTTQSRARVL
jgi:NAD(P)-dependent dehydrogenase (short-subunit alcohol dehydrogenase family)